MPKLCCAVDCRNIAAATIAVNTSVGVEDSGPPTAPFDSAWKTGQETILWLCYMIIYCRYCCVGRVHHLVSLFCDRWQKNGDARFRFFGALHGLYTCIRISVCGSCSSFMLWCSSCRARPSGHVLICLGLVHIVALQRGALAIFFCLDLVHIVALQSSVLLYHWQYSNLHNLYSEKVNAVSCTCWSNRKSLTYWIPLWNEIYNGRQNYWRRWKCRKWYSDQNKIKYYTDSAVRNS